MAKIDCVGEFLKSPTRLDGNCPGPDVNANSALLGTGSLVTSRRHHTEFFINDLCTFMSKVSSTRKR